MLYEVITGMGVDRIMGEIITKIPSPVGDPDAPLQALIFDSVFNSFRGIIAYFNRITSYNVCYTKLLRD